MAFKNKDNIINLYCHGVIGYYKNQSIRGQMVYINNNIRIHTMNIACINEEQCYKSTKNLLISYIINYSFRESRF